MAAKKKIIFLASFVVFIVLLVLLYLDRVKITYIIGSEEVECIVFRTIQEYDSKILLFINPDGNIAFFNAFFLFITTYIDLAIPIIVLILFILSFFVQSLKRYQFIFLIVLLAYLINALATNELKELFGRARPQRIPDVSIYYFGDINPLQTITGTTSFPSGHTSTAFAVMVPLIIYVKPKWLKGGFLAYACLQGLSRMWVGAHFPSDVLIGAWLGTMIAILIYYTIRDVIFRINPEDL